MDSLYKSYGRLTHRDGWVHSITALNRVLYAGIPDWLLHWMNSSDYLAYGREPKMKTYWLGMEVEG